MDRDDYINKMNIIVKDESKIKNLGPVSDFDNILKIEKKINDRFKELISSEELLQAIVNELKPIGSMRSGL